MRKTLVFLALTFLTAFLPVTTRAATTPSVLINEQTVFTPAAPTVTTIDTQALNNTTLSGYLTPTSGIPIVQTTVASDGSISVFDAVNVIVYEFTATGELTRQQTFTKPFGVYSNEYTIDRQAGAFIKDDLGNYYICYGKPTEVDDNNMVLIKYSPDGKQLQEFWMAASEWTISVPFNLSSCRLMISGDMIAMHTARQHFFSDKNGVKHQSSLSVILDINTFERLTMSPSENGVTAPGLLITSSVPHSFDQHILPLEDGFVFTDLGDGSPRAFNFTKVVKNEIYPIIAESFAFEGAAGDNFTDAQLGGLVKTPTGYLFAGAYNQIKPQEGARNLFVLNMDEKFEGAQTPIWLTDYAPNLRVISPKIVSLSEGKHLLMWEVHAKDDYVSQGTYMAVIDDNAQVLSTKKLPTGVSLNNYDNLRYNTVTGLVHWTIHYGQKFELYSLDPLA